MKDAMEPQLTESGNIKDVEKEFIQLGFENITLTPILLVAEGNEKKKDNSLTTLLFLPSSPFPLLRITEPPHISRQEIVALNQPNSHCQFHVRQFRIRSQLHCRRRR